MLLETREQILWLMSNSTLKQSCIFNFETNKIFINPHVFDSRSTTAWLVGPEMETHQGQRRPARKPESIFMDTEHVAHFSTH